jgi:hypothetical protein
LTDLRRPTSMNSPRLRTASLSAALITLATLAVLPAGCAKPSRDLQPGSYRATLEVPGADIPFGLDVAREETGFVLYLVNGEQRVRISDVKAAPGRLSAVMPGSGGRLTATISGGALRGEVTFPRARGRNEVLAFKADLGKTWRFFADPLTDNADVSGRWAVTFTDGQGRRTPGVAVLSQSYEHVTGTMLLRSGEQRFLTGEVRGNELRLSRFDGDAALLYHAKVDARGALQGQYWSGRNVRLRFVAVRDVTLSASASAPSLARAAAPP